MVILSYMKNMVIRHDSKKNEINKFKHIIRFQKYYKGDVIYIIKAHQN